MDSGGSMRRPSVEQELTPLRRILFACVRLVSAGKTVPFAQKRDRGVLSATDAPVPPSSADGPLHPSCSPHRRSCDHSSATSFLLFSREIFQCQ